MLKSIKVLSLAAFLVAAATTGARSEMLTVFGAASLADVLTEIGKRHQSVGGDQIRFSFAASSTLARQIEAGAPADIVVLASAEWADYLAKRGLILPQSRVNLAGNRLVLVAPTGRGFDASLTADGIAALLGQEGRMVIGDPAHVPAGIYARAALENLGLWDVVANRLALADNVRAALALVARGEVPLGIVYATDATATPEVAVIAEFPPGSHPPITYPVAILTGRDGAASRAFLTLLTGPEGRAIFRSHGFMVE